VSRHLNICFHGIGAPGRSMEPGEPDYWVSVDLFQQVLDEVARHPGVRLSFDDGNSSDVEVGLPALVERGLDADFFVLAGRLGQPGSLAPQDVEALARAGMSIGSHGMDHRPWRGMDTPTTERELVVARREIEAVAGRRVDTAALPLGRYDRRTLRTLRRLGYTRVHSSDRRWARTGEWLQPRFSVRASDTIEGLRADVFRPASRLAQARLDARGLVKSLR
jgi:peptidoglycan/xylan/chitin deacetylase (PgdA/CDA1 family)